MPLLIVGQLDQVALKGPFQLKPAYDSVIFGNQKLCNFLLLLTKQLWFSASRAAGRRMPERQNACSQWVWLLGSGGDDQDRAYQDSTKKKSPSWSMLWEKLTECTHSFIAF